MPLHLDRFVGERIFIGEGPDLVIVEVMSIRANGRVRLGITAPDDILIDREEVRLRDQRQVLEVESRHD